MKHSNDLSSNPDWFYSPNLLKMSLRVGDAVKVGSDGEEYEVWSVNELRQGIVCLLKIKNGRPLFIKESVRNIHVIATGA